MMLRFSEPMKLNTKRVVFEDAFLACDSGTLEQLKELSSTRRIIEEFINDRSFITEAVAREMSGGSTLQCEQEIQKIEKYLPLLENLIHHVNLVGDNPRIVRWTSDLGIRWSSAFPSSSFFNIMGQKFFQVDNLLFELNMMLFLNAALLREWASEVLSKDLVQSATLFRKAAGVHHYLAHEMLPSLQTALPPERPPEATVSVSSAICLICLADAQAVIIRKSEEKGNAITLLSKLHYGIVQMLDEATAIMHSATGDCKDFLVHIVEFISSCKTLHQLRSNMYLAEGLKTDGQIGVAIGVLQHALITAQKNIPGKETSRLFLKQEVDNLTELLRKYEHENDFVWHDKIPFHHELPLPEGKKIVNFIPYRPQRWERALSFKL